MALVVGFTCVACQCVCWVVTIESTIFDCRNGAVKEPEEEQANLVEAPRSHGELLKELHAQGRVVRMQARLMLLVVLVPLAAAAWTSCAGGLPLWAYGLYLPFLVYNKAVEVQLLVRLQVRSSGGMAGRLAKHL